MSSASAIWHPFTQHGLMEPIPLVKRAAGAALFLADGTRVIDAISSWWVTTHGHNHPRISAAIAAEAQKLDQIIFAGWTHEPAEQLARDLVAMVPEPLSHVFFSDSGSTSVEVALKMALGYWANCGEPRHRILVLEHSYHGDTIGAMSVGARGVFNQAYEALLFDVETIPFPLSGREQASLDALEAACRAERVAAFIVEPLVLGVGGMLMYPAWVLREMRLICERYKVLFIADEVMTGWGRTGTLLACEQAGVAPDLLCLAKGLTGGALPLAVTLATPAIFAAHSSRELSRQFFHSSSYTANPIACSAANANLAIWRDDPVLSRIDELASQQAAILRNLSRLPGVINPRQTGTIVAFDVVGETYSYLAEVGLNLRSIFRESNVLLRPLGNTVYIMPPYCIEMDDLATIEENIANAIVQI